MKQRENKPPTPGPSARRYFKEVRFRQIRALVVLSREGGFAGAAASLGLAVPSVWQQIRALEDEYGVQLVVARGAQVSLTEDGQSLVELAEPLVEGFDSLRAMFADRHRTTPRTLSIVAPAPMLHGALRKPIAAYRKKFPGVNLKLIDRPSLLARELIEADGADIAILGIAQGDEPLPQFRVWPVASYPFQLICPNDHPLATARRITLSDIVQHPLVLSVEESSSHRQIRHIFNQAGLGGRMNVTTTASNRALLLDYVAIRLGVTICTGSNDATLPKPGPGECELTMRNIAPLFGQEEVFLLQRKSRHELPHVKVFRETVMDSLGGSR
jgi:DNA-binding transcriptional LysR family regulator